MGVGLDALTARVSGSASSRLDDEDARGGEAFVALVTLRGCSGVSRWGLEKLERTESTERREQLRICVTIWRFGSSHPWQRVHILGIVFGACSIVNAYRGTSLIRNRRPLGPYMSTMSRDLWGS